MTMNRGGEGNMGVRTKRIVSSVLVGISCVVLLWLVFKALLEIYS